MPLDMSAPARITRLEEAMADLAVAQKEAQQAHKEAEQARKESELAWRKQWGELANKMGTLVEDIVAPGLPGIFRSLFGVKKLEMSAQRVERGHRSVLGRSREFDYVAMGGGILLVNETKSTLRPSDLTPFLEALDEIREYFPEAADCEVVGCLASMTIAPSLVTAGERHGLLMLGLATGLRILNSPGFKPRRY